MLGRYLLDGWMDGLVDERMDGCLDDWEDGWIAGGAIQDPLKSLHTHTHTQA